MRFAYMPDSHFGVYGQEPAPVEVNAAFRQCISEAEVAEEYGFDGVFLAERHARAETMIPNPVPLAAAIAACTERVRIATTVMNPTYHDPMHLAEDLAEVDNLSKGRLIFGAGTGYHKDYFNLFGVPFKNTGDRFEEAMDVIVGAWTNERFNYDGKFFQYHEAFLTPKPFQQPRPPIWIGGFVDKAIERALDYDGWIWWFPPEPDEAAETVKKWRDRAAERGKTDWVFGISQEGFCGRDAAETRRRHAYRWLHETGYYTQHPGDGVYVNASNEEDAIKEFERRWLTCGSPQQWVDAIGEIQERLDPEWLNIRMRNPRPPEGHYPDAEECYESIQMLGEEVIRHFQR